MDKEYHKPARGLFRPKLLIDLYTGIMKSIVTNNDHKDILAADIGGTSSRFAHFRIKGAGEDDELTLVATKWLDTKSTGSFSELLGQLNKDGLRMDPSSAHAACIAIAGPVRGLVSTPPNIPWDVDLNEPEALGLPKNTLLINDFIAQAFACISRPGHEAMTILEGDRDPEGTIAVLGPGTGLGKAALVHHEAGYTPMPSEGGHAAFPFFGAREMEFAEFLLGHKLKEHKDGYISLDSVVTGRGLSYLHEFLTGAEVHPEEIDPNSETFALAARFLGRAARDFALLTLSTGGLFITGGVAARNPGLVRSEEFRQEFLLNAKMRHVLERIPVRLMIDQDSGLWGAAQYCQNALRQEAA